VPPPRPAGGTLAVTIAPLPPLAEDPARRWRRYPLFKGETAAVAMGCHASVLSRGHVPHPPHAHAEEELLIALEGECELLLHDGADGQSRSLRIKPGAFVYYPSGLRHTIRNPGEDPVAYLMFRWRAWQGAASPEVAARLIDYGDAFAVSERPFATRRLLDLPTRWLKRLEAHTSVVRPGGGYAAHVDRHDVAVLLLEGEIETAGRTVMSPAAIYYPAGTPHGLRAAGPAPARYLVFEFHGRPGAMGGGPAPWRRAFGRVAASLKALRWWRR
jgi:mannose-6-phosphate isomerase-like protein (cupin superfamily)